MNFVEVGQYFKHRYYDENLIKFLSCKYCNLEETIFTLDHASENEKLKELFKVTMEIKKDMNAFELKKKKKLNARVAHYKKTYSSIELQLKLMNRIAERETNWIVYPLLHVASGLLKVTLELSKRLRTPEFNESCGRSIHRCFTICLNDRNPKLNENKKIGIYVFANLEFKIYHELNNMDMVRNLIKVLKSRDSGNEIPSLRESLAIKYNSNIVTFNYFMGKYYTCVENDFTQGYKYLMDALLECTVRDKKQINKILVLLIPCAIISRKVYPNFETVERFQKDDVIPKLYKPIVECLLNGNLDKFEKVINNETVEIFILKNGLYVAINLIRELVFLKLIKTAVMQIENKAVVSLRYIATAYKKSLHLQNTDEESLLNELECLLANLISKKLVKGYLSHSNRCIVLSKAEPFPKQVLA
ncbi:hypothetical protein KAFR_0G01020 [Kazachstania africana CBS 2517]|uniref:PCI domain-containing protein n=1 Tax=Kazachstania africana (strain ATCC 22294 / BCRC 22015 / CBS 2517 / CECT 1963 / NBRC 1671 / NRRL Y-8276) TaxID=1071382 RepID=H2AXN5_KAZAF|nr:hypothetical protein KAFR_0G01020 [Kazachstania africana CBS 2517]CCF59135.1 hypothetical protein KAFR_0G01020 [Kazachstania africana CBS 2517]